MNKEFPYILYKNLNQITVRMLRKNQEFGMRRRPPHQI